MEKRPLTDRGRMTHICVSKLSHHWFRYWLVASCLREPLSEPMLAYYLFDPRDYNAMHQSTKKQGRSEGFDICDRPSNLAQI